jgi:hypothetical protein
VSKQGRLGKLLASIRRLPHGIKEAVLAYEKSYNEGVEKFGIWWKVFQWSMWLFILIFIGTAVVAFVFFLPKIEMVRHF